ASAGFLGNLLQRPIGLRSHHTLPVEIGRLQANRVHHHFVLLSTIEHGAESRLAVRIVAVREHEHDFSTIDRLQHLDALIDCVPEARRVAVLQIAQRGDQVVAVVGELAAELDPVAERAHLPFVLRQHPQQELFGGRAQEIEAARHAGAVMQHHHDGKRLGFVLEERDLLWLSVIEDGELVLLEIRDEASLGVEHGSRHRHDLGRRLEGRRLLLCRHYQGGRDEHRNRRKGPHEISLSDLRAPRRRRRPGYHSRMRTVCLAAGLLVSLACSSQAQQQGGQEAAARIGDRTVTVRELDDRWKKEDPAAKAQADQTVYDGRRSALDAIIADALVADAAKAKGVTTEKFVQDEVAKRLKPVGDTDVRNFYVQNSERMQGRSFEQMSGAIQRYLEEQHQNDAKQAL